MCEGDELTTLFMNELLEKKKVHRWAGVHWYIDRDWNGNPEWKALCPKNKCHCKIKKSKEPYLIGEYKYTCIKCDFKITLSKSLEDCAVDILDIIETQGYKDADVINLEGDLIRIGKEEVKDDDYWIDAKLSKNNRGEVQLMVMAGHKKIDDKVQLFIDPKNERLAFDQNNRHPREVFSKVTAVFKNSISEILLKDE